MVLTYFDAKICLYIFTSVFVGNPIRNVIELPHPSYNIDCRRFFKCHERETIRIKIEKIKIYMKKKKLKFFVLALLKLLNIMCFNTFWEH